MHRVQHLNVPVVLGIVLLKSARMARFMNRHVAGIQVPDHLIEEMESAGDKAEASVEISARLIRDMRPMCQGVHLMTLDWVHKVPAILDAAGLAETV
jgi:5,10-methylenetetrahydrofolate reductase